MLLVALCGAAPAELRTIATAHYCLHTDVADGPLVDDLARRLDATYDEYGAQLPDFRRPVDAPPMDVYLFAQRDRYAAFSHFPATNTGGCFVPGPRPFLASFVDGQTHDELRATLRHEGFHQFAHAALGRRLPVWLNEGMAQMFEEFVWTGRGFLVGQVTPRRVRQLQSDRDRHTLVPIAKLIAITPGEWATTLARDVNAGESNYNTAWALAHWLTFAAGDRDRWSALLRKLHESDDRKSTAAAIRECFPDPAATQRAFDAWVHTLRPTDEATLIDRQSTLGDFLVDYRRAGRTFPDVAALHATAARQHLRVTYVRGLVRRTTDADVGVYFADPAGVPFGPRDLFFDPAPAAPLPDLVCHATASLTVRTHFYRDAKGAVNHEVAVETADAAPSQ